MTAETTLVFKPDLCFPPSKVAHSFHVVTVVGTTTDSKTGKEVEIKEGQMIDLVPGVNYLAADKYESLKNHPDYPQYQKWGAIVEYTPAIEEKAAGVTENSLSRYSADDAQDIIAAQDDVAILKEWLENEARKTVRRAINARITQIEAGAE